MKIERIKVRPADKREDFFQEASDGYTACITGKGNISASNSLLVKGISTSHYVN